MSLTGLLHRYKKAENGVTAVEFALLLVPFITLLMGIIELSLFYASGVVLEGAATGASRLVRTGQAQTSADPAATFETELCGRVGVMIDCDNITYEAVNFGNSFNGAGAAEMTTDENGNMVSSGFDAGAADQVIMIRMAYRHEFFFPLLGRFLGDDTGTNSAQHVSTVVLRTEPYVF